MGTGAERQRRYIQRLKTGVSDGALVTKLRGRIKELKAEIASLTAELKFVVDENAKIASVTPANKGVSDSNIIDED